MPPYIPIHTNFDLAFKDGHVFHAIDQEISVRVVAIGDLNLPSGRISAFDPGITDAEQVGTYAFKTRVKPGKYQAFVSMALVGADHERVAAAMVRFKNTEAVRWEMAESQNQDLADLEPGQIFGYGVDCGTGAFVDPAAYDDAEDDEEFIEELWAAMDENEGEWANKALGSANMVAFHSGWGDGVYSSYFGFDASGEPCCVATDFDVLTECISERAVFRDLPSLFGKRLEHPDFLSAGIEVELHPVAADSHAILLKVIKGHPDVKMLDDEIKAGMPFKHQSHNREVTIFYKCDLSEACLILKFVKEIRALE